MHNGQLRPVKFASHSFTPTESRWPTTHQELFAIKWGLEHFRPYVLGRKITVITDHANLKFLTLIASQQSKLARWCLSMAEFDFVIEHCPGVDHVVPDTLSCAPLPEPSPVGDTLVLPPIPISLFLATMVGYDIPSHHPSLVSKVFSYPLDCISLACSPDPPNTWAPQPLVEPSTKLLSSQPPRQLIEEVQQKHNVPSRPLNVSRETLAKRQRADKWLGPMYQSLFSQEDTSVLHGLDKQVQTWVKANASNCKIVDDLIMYSDKLMTDPHHHHIFIPSDPDLQCHLLTAYYDSPISMHRVCIYNTLSQDFYWRNMHKNVKNWVRRCPQCIRFKTIQPAHGPMQLRLYQHLFHTLGIDFVGELPMSPTGNKWILTAVCPYSNCPRAIPVPDKTDTTAAYALVNDVFLSTGFPSVLQSDHGGEWLNALLHRITKLLSIKHVFTSGFWPHLMVQQNAPIVSLTRC